MSVAAISSSGLRAASAAMDAGAFNVANRGTPGFRRELVSTVAQPQGGVQAQVTRAAAPGEAPEADMVGMLAAKDAFAANLDVFKRADDALGKLLDLSA